MSKLEKKILLIAPANPQNKLARSGVYHSIYNALSKHYKVEWISSKVTGVHKILYWFVESAIRLIRKIGGYGILMHNPLISKIVGSYINKQIKYKEYDAIFSFDCVDFAFLKTSKPIFYRSDALFHLFLNYYIHKTPNLFVRLGDSVERRALNRVTKMFAPSAWVINGARKFYPSIPENKFELVESGANLQREFVVARERLYEAQTLNLLFIGYDLERKGFDIACQTTEILNKKYNIEARLIVVGGKPSDDILANKAIIYQGKLDKNKSDEREKMYAIMNSSDLFIFPTRAECHGIVNCEACAFGLPIFSYNTGGVSSYVLDDVNGFTMPLNSTADDFAKKIAECKADGRLRSFSKNARRLYEDRFNWDVWSNRVVSTMNSFMDK